jgi:hypothetical protein
MSRHVSRRERWSKVSPIEWRSGAGLRVYYERGAWWAEVTYRRRTEDDPSSSLISWEPHTDRLGPFKRPRNGQVEAERHLTFLQNRRGDLFTQGA